MTWCEYKLGEVTQNFRLNEKPVKGTDRTSWHFRTDGASGIVAFCG